MAGKLLREHLRPGGIMAEDTPAKDFNDQRTGHVAGSINGQVGMYQPGMKKGPNGGVTGSGSAEPYL
jgi:hypothetical protein